MFQGASVAEGDKDAVCHPNLIKCPKNALMTKHFAFFVSI
jgi:hypothetical protein